MNYILAIDQGTSSTRAMLFTLSGELIASSQYDLTQFYPQAGWVEHDPEEIWSTTVLAIKTVTAGINPQRIIACGITNQRETTLVWDKLTGECLAPAIVWQDRRTQTYCQALSDKAEMIQSKTGLLPDAYFSASKLHWLLTNIPEARNLISKNRLAFGTVDSFLLWRLTKGHSHATDCTNASRTMLFNIFSKTWDQELLNLFAIPESILPEVRDCDDHFGDMDESILGHKIPITGIAGDQQAALIGQCCFEAGTIKATYGTGGFLLLNTGANPVLSKHRLLTTVAYSIKGQTTFALEGSIYQAGTTIQWLRDELNLFADAEETHNLARSIIGNEGVYLIPSFTGLGAPHWSSRSGAVMVGLSRNTGAAHFVRAALESVAYQTRDILDCMQHETNLPLALLRVDGGMAQNVWFLQFLSSLNNLRVEKPKNIETTALGVAMLAALGCGQLTSLRQMQEHWAYENQYLPRDYENMEKNYQGWLDALAMFLR